jgi:phosphate transport system protein
MLPAKLDDLRNQLILYANHAESMIVRSIEALLQQDKQALLAIVGDDEVKANHEEISIEEFCIEIIAKYEPKARDLRTVLMVMKINNDLERIADHAVNTAESGLFLIDHPQLKPLIDIPRMAEVANMMLKDSIIAFISQDSLLAEKVCQRDSLVDALASQILRELITFMLCDPATIERSLHLLKISKNLERIADLSTNICEDVIYMVDGRIIKHCTAIEN